MPKSVVDALYCGLVIAAMCLGRVAAQGTSSGDHHLAARLSHLGSAVCMLHHLFSSKASLCAAGPSCSALGLPATAASNSASYVKCQSFGGTNWCQSSEAPGWEPCPVLNGQSSPAPDPVQSVSDAKTVSSEHTHLLM